MRRLFLSIILLPALVSAAPPRPRTGAPAARPAPAPAAPRLPYVILPPDPSPRDVAIAEAAQHALKGVAGSVVALDPFTGRVRTIVNPALGLSSAYQPCSVFKIVVAIAGLTENVITPQTTYTCQPGGGCWFWAGHGPIELRRALAYSCNPFFQWVGGQLGYERVKKYATLLGLGDVSGVNLPGESPGAFPPREGLDVAHMSSHADRVATTALQVAGLIATAINGGTLFQPQLAPEAGLVPKERWRLPAGTVLGGLSEGFLGAVNEGSAADAFDRELIVAGKTGTCAGVGWFASYAPADKPDTVLVVFLRPGSGHAASAVAGKIYQEAWHTSASLAGSNGGH